MRRLLPLITVLLLAAGCAQAPPAPAASPAGPPSARVETAAAPPAPAQAPVASAPITLATAPDCGGRAVTVQGVPARPGDFTGLVTPPPYRSLQVSAAGGGPLLTLQDERGYATARFLAVAEDRVLLVSSQENEPGILDAYLCAAEGLRRLPWDGEAGLWGRFMASDSEGLHVALAGYRQGEEVPVVYRMEDGQLCSHIPAAVRAAMTTVQELGLAPGLRLSLHRLPPGWQKVQVNGPLLVTDGAGRTLLERPYGVTEIAGLRNAGAPYPLLILMNPRGGSMGMYYEAYFYDSAQAQLVQVSWDRQTFAISTSGVEQAGDLLRTTGRSEAAVGRRMATILWQYRDGALQPVRTEFTAPPYPKDELDVLLLAFDTVSKRLPDETPRYFADPEQARRFYANLAGQLPQDGFPFCAECAYQRLPAQGPVFIWTPDARMSLPPSRLFAVAPGFRAGPLGPQIATLTVTLVTLTVPDVTAALQLLHQQPELQQRNIPEPVFQGGFWTVRVPGAGIWRINPRTGEVQRSQ